MIPAIKILAVLGAAWGIYDSFQREQFIWTGFFAIMLVVVYLMETSNNRS